jgi:phosphoglycolate phosphatase
MININNSRPFIAFIFDLDGTLVDSRPSIEKSAQMAIASALPNLTGISVSSFIGPPIRQMFRLSLGVEDEALLDQLVSAFRKAYDSGICRESKAYPNVVQVLRSIVDQGVNNYVITNKPYSPTRQILESIGCENLIHEILTPDCRLYPFDTKKEALSSLIKRHHLESNSVLMVGDSMDDFEAAKFNGVRFVAALYGYGGFHAKDFENCTTAFCIENMLELINVM